MVPLTHLSKWLNRITAEQSSPWTVKVTTRYDALTLDGCHISLLKNLFDILKWIQNASLGIKMLLWGRAAWSLTSNGFHLSFTHRADQRWERNLPALWPPLLIQLDYECYCQCKRFIWKKSIMCDIYEISSLTNAPFNKPFAIFNYYFWHYMFEICRVESRRRPVSLAASCQEGYQSKNLCQIKHVDPSQCGLPLGVREQPKMKKTIPLYSYRPSKHDLNSWPWSKLIAVWLQVLNCTRADDCVDFLRNIDILL